MNDTINTCRVEGEILLDGQNIYNPEVDPVIEGKSWDGFSKAQSVSKSIYDNVAWTKIHDFAIKN